MPEGGRAQLPQGKREKEGKEGRRGGNVRKGKIKSGGSPMDAMWRRKLQEQKEEIGDQGGCVHRRARVQGKSQGRDSGGGW